MIREHSFQVGVATRKAMTQLSRIVSLVPKLPTWERPSGSAASRLGWTATDVTPPNVNVITCFTRIVSQKATLKYEEEFFFSIAFRFQSKFDFCDSILVSVHGYGIKVLGKSRTLTTCSEAHFDLRVSFRFRKDSGL